MSGSVDAGVDVAGALAEGAFFFLLVVVLLSFDFGDCADGVAWHEWCN